MSSKQVKRQKYLYLHPLHSEVEWITGHHIETWHDEAHFKTVSNWWRLCCEHAKLKSWRRTRLLSQLLGEEVSVQPSYKLSWSILTPLCILRWPLYRGENHFSCANASISFYIILFFVFFCFLSANMPGQNLLCRVTRWAADRPCFSHVPTLFPLCASLVWHWLFLSADIRNPLSWRGLGRQSYGGRGQLADNKPPIMTPRQMQVVV